MPNLVHASVVVLGSLNLDRVWHLPALPRRGQTLLAGATSSGFGGKGANQAMAAARQGASVQMIGAVGNDEPGRRYLAHLQRENIDVAGVKRRAGSPTGSAQIYLDPSGENMIAVDPGANGTLTPEEVTAELAFRLPAASLLLSQLETPLPAALASLTLAAQAGVRTVLNAAPVSQGFPWGSVPIDTVILNEHECADAFGITPAALLRENSGQRKGRLERWNIRHLIITQGADATVCLSAEAACLVPTHPVQPVDTVGAGDTFCGALAAALAAGAAWEVALGRANVAAALSTLGFGAQAAMPTRGQVDAHVSAGASAGLVFQS